MIDSCGILTVTCLLKTVLQKDLETKPFTCKKGRGGPGLSISNQIFFFLFILNSLFC